MAKKKVKKNNRFKFVILGILLFLYIIYVHSNNYLDFQQNNLLREIGKEVLLVTAHPDDESVFFSPIVSFLCAHKVHVSLLTLTAGDMCNGVKDSVLAIQRLKELQKSCTVLGV